MKRKQFDMVLATVEISATWISNKLTNPDLSKEDREAAAMELWALEETLEILESHREMGVLE